MICRADRETRQLIRNCWRYWSARHAGGRLSMMSQARELISEKAGLAYPIRDGIPVMLVEEARRL